MYYCVLLASKSLHWASWQKNSGYFTPPTVFKSGLFSLPLGDICITVATSLSPLICKRDTFYITHRQHRQKLFFFVGIASKRSGEEKEEREIKLRALGAYMQKIVQ